MSLPTVRSPTEIGCHVQWTRLRGLDLRESACRRLSYSPPRRFAPLFRFFSSRSLFPAVCLSLPEALRS
jgi:hypothetical protein